MPTNHPIFTNPTSIVVAPEHIIKLLESLKASVINKRSPIDNTSQTVESIVDEVPKF